MMEAHRSYSVYPEKLGTTLYNRCGCAAGEAETNILKIGRGRGVCEALGRVKAYRFFSRTRRNRWSAGLSRGFDSNTFVQSRQQTP